MILILRGHIRKSFTNSKLHNLVKSILNIDSNLKIYIHTWNIVANNISWRKIDIDNTLVTKEMIYDYFGELQNLIKHIIIDDDSKISLIGNLEGNINSKLTDNGTMSILGWKNYWYGQYQIIDYLYHLNININEMIINCRFDILDNCNTESETDVLQFIERNIINNMINNFIKNVFIKDYQYYGIDNIYIGNIKTMYLLIHHFQYYLDDILLQHTDTIHQEFLVFRLNNILFL